MSTEDPEMFSSPADTLQPLPSGSAALEPPARIVSRPRTIPNFGHTALFFAVAVAVMILASVSVFALVMGLHLMGHESSDQLLREPRLLIPSMAVGYGIAGVIVWAVFTWLWRVPFARGLRWNAGVVRRRWPWLLAGGVMLSLVVQFLSNFLPIPKTLPIDDFFRTPGDVWMVALFGTLIAPVFEELAFRGFLLPSLASAWDWLRTPKEVLLANYYGQTDYATPVQGQPVSSARNAAGAESDPQWSAFALLVSCFITSVAFALVHADQLAHAWAPLAVLFGVSLVLCGVRLWTHSLAASTFIHATYNGTIFTILFFATGGFRHLDKIS